MAPGDAPQAVTQLLKRWSDGDRGALDALMPLVYDELNRIARRHLSREQPGHTLQPTALVHEAFVKLVGEREMDWQSRTHFVAVAAQTMRFILVDHFRRKRMAKRGGPDAVHVTFDEELGVAAHGDERLLDLDEALTRLTEQDQRKGRIVELRYFGGLSVEETAAALDVSVATVMRDWRMAQAWLQRELA
jgi:RNA polymerase sigma-70 factor (ECF subfamily)